MPINVGKCPIPFPGIGNNRQCMAVAEVSLGVHFFIEVIDLAYL